MGRPTKRPSGRGRGRPCKMSKIEPEEVDKKKDEEIEKVEEAEIKENAEKKVEETEKNEGTMPVEEEEKTEEAANSEERSRKVIRIATIYNITRSPGSDPRRAMDFVRAIEDAQSRQSPVSDIRSAITEAITNVHAAIATISKDGNTNVQTRKTDVEAGKTDVKAGKTDVKAGKTDVEPGKTDVEAGKTDVETGKTDSETELIDLDFGSSEDEFGLSDDDDEYLDGIIRIREDEMGALGYDEDGIADNITGRPIEKFWKKCDETENTNDRTRKRKDTTENTNDKDNTKENIWTFDITKYPPPFEESKYLIDEAKNRYDGTGVVNNLTGNPDDGTGNTDVCETGNADVFETGHEDVCDETGNASVCYETGIVDVCETENSHEEIGNVHEETENAHEETENAQDGTGKADVQKDTTEDRNSVVESTEENNESRGACSRSDNFFDRIAFWERPSSSNGCFSNYFENKDNAPNSNPSQLLRCLDVSEADDEDIVHIKIENDDKICHPLSPEEEEDEEFRNEDSGIFKSGLFEDDSSCSEDMPDYVQQWPDYMLEEF